MSPEITLSFAWIEGEHLVHLLEQFQELLRTDAATGPADPALNRLAPDPYPEDADASRAFATATRDDLMDRRASEIAVVLSALSAFQAEGREPDGDRVDVVIPGAAVDAWLRTLTALRLVIADRLGIRVDDDLAEDDPRRGIYDWLGYRLEMLVLAADEAD